MVLDESFLVELFGGVGVLGVDGVDSCGAGFVDEVGDFFAGAGFPDSAGDEGFCLVEGVGVGSGGFETCAGGVPVSDAVVGDSLFVVFGECLVAFCGVGGGEDEGLDDGGGDVFVGCGGCEVDLVPFVGFLDDFEGADGGFGAVVAGVGEGSVVVGEQGGFVFFSDADDVPAEGVVDVFG